ncbi:Sybindin-like protein [Protomyces lactucae-debilis]|uniref:Trafficking protein particle complex subunit n=1 Tax=Protomyces lactucae-debilis TaxID=2754530 RepID=A0A1Y2F6D1_PROLT|nr:Sybindin-like protein [Protomyces lactucae-debilis]ORY79460.1 Sybindin-like protein [Protomyces lactucae-debilis]
MIHSLYIINKAGGLIFQADYAAGLTKLSANDYLILAGTFHGVHAISSQISPVAGSSGIEVLETETFRLQCFQTLTGIKFLLFTEPRQTHPDQLLHRIYELYADYVMKNPFYQLEMPIRCHLFDKTITSFCTGTA